GDGTFQAAQTFLGGAGVVGLVAADLDNDGSPDLAVANFAGNSVSGLINASAPPASHLLTVNKSGTGSGTGTASPAAINCGSACAATYTGGTVVTLSA